MPLNTNCRAFKNNTQSELPVRIKKSIKLTDLHLIRFIVINGKNEVLLYKKNDKEWLSDQWELPTGVIEPPKILYSILK